VTRIRPRSATEPQALSKQRLRLWLRVLKVQRLAAGALRNKLRDAHDTTLPRFDVLAALYRNPRGLTMSRLSDALAVSNGNVTGIVERLVAEGRIVRVAVAGDRRATEVRLTPHGLDHFAELASAHEAWVDRLFASLDAEETAQLTTLLDKAVAHLARETRP
jgi:DNA-binding MarR family transcriptional regulator